MNPYNQPPNQPYGQPGYPPQGYPQQGYPQQPQPGFTPTQQYYPPANYAAPQNLYPNAKQQGPSSQFSVSVPGLLAVSVPTSFGLHKGNHVSIGVPGVTLSVPANDPHHPHVHASNVTGQTFYTTTTTTTTQGPQPVFGSQPQAYPQPSYPQPNGFVGFQPMDPNSFNQLKNQVSKENFSSGKLTVIEVASKNHFFTSQQVYEMVKTLTFAKDQLEACRFMYPKVVDQANFHIVLSAFTFESDKKKLKEMLRL